MEPLIHCRFEKLQQGLLVFVKSVSPVLQQVATCNVEAGESSSGGRKSDVLEWREIGLFYTDSSVQITDGSSFTYSPSQL